MSNEAPTDALRLVPCPFCGGDVIHTRSQEMTEGPAYYWHKCETCGAESEGDYGEDVAVTAWNRRAAPASPLPEGGGTSYAAGGLDVLSRIRLRLNEQIERAEADLNSTVTIRLNDAKAIRHLLAPAAPTGKS